MELVQKKPGTSTDLQIPEPLVSTQQTMQISLSEEANSCHRNRRILVSFEQITTAGADTAAGSKLPRKCDSSRASAFYSLLLSSPVFPVFLHTNEVSSSILISFTLVQ